MDESTPKPRVNVSMFAEYQGQYVTVVGRAHKPDQNGMSFHLTSSDNKEINVRLQEPLQEYVSGVVQVQGLCDGRDLVNSTFVLFNEENKQFDLEQYNQAINLLAQFQENVIPAAQVAK